MATVERENIGLLNDKLIVKIRKEDYLPSFEGYSPLTQVCIEKKFEKMIRKNFTPEKAFEYLSFYYYDKELTQKRAFVFLGEISNMKGHGVYMDFEGKGHWGYHCDQFEPTDGDDCAFRLNNIVSSFGADRPN